MAQVMGEFAAIRIVANIAYALRADTNIDGHDGNAVVVQPCGWHVATGIDHDKQSRRLSGMLCRAQCDGRSPGRCCMVAHIGQRRAGRDIECGITFIFVSGLVHVDLGQAFDSGRSGSVD